MGEAKVPMTHKLSVLGLNICQVVEIRVPVPPDSPDKSLCLAVTIYCLGQVNTEH